MDVNIGMAVLAKLNSKVLIPLPQDVLYYIAAKMSFSLSHFIYHTIWLDIKCCFEDYKPRDKT